MVVFVAMSAVAFGVLPATELGASGVPMTAAAARYLPFGATVIVTLGAIMAIATSLNATMLVPARLAWHLAREGRMPRFLGRLHPTLRTPLPGLALSFGIAAVLLVSGRMGLALGIAVVALMTLYALHSVALLLLPRANPELYGQVATRIPRWLQIAAAALSAGALSLLVGMQFFGDLRRMIDTPALPRLTALDLTSLELLLVWLGLGLILYAGSRRRRRQ